MLEAISFPKIFKPLFEDYRYVIYYGGRGGAKSWQFAIALLLIGASRAITVLCAREIQRSIADSVHALLSNQIKRLEIEIPHLKGFYSVTKNAIYGQNGTKFTFVGLYANQSSIKSYEGADYCWVEEAESISEKSWEILIPTIRKDGSQIWVSFNPSRDDDPTYERFITNKDSLVNAHVKYVTYKDNKHFGEPLKSEMEAMKKTNPSKYRHIWLGEPIADYDSLVFRFDRQVNLTERNIKYNEGYETWTFWDFGVSPSDTYVGFAQIVPSPDREQFPLGYVIYIFDEYCNNNKPATHYREVVEQKGYFIDRHACDPAGRARDASLQSWVSILERNKKGKKDWHFEYCHKYGVAERIDMANDIISHIRYNPSKVPVFHKMAFKWQYRTDRDGKVIEPPKPEHDEYSHPGTAFYYFVENRFPPKGKPKVRVIK